MLRFEKCHPRHIACINPQEEQSADVAALLTPENHQVILDSTALSAWYSERCLAAAGITQQWKGRAVAWALFGKDAKDYMIPIVRKIRQVVDDHPVRRLEMLVLCDFEAGHKLAKLLGFTVETPRKPFYYPDGRDVTEYVRIR